MKKRTLILCSIASTFIICRADETIKHLSQGVQLYEEKKLEQALVHFQKVLDLNPENYHVLSMTAMTFHRLEKTAEAAHYYRLALRQNPKDHSAQYNLANILLSFGNTDEAQGLFEDLHQRMPHDQIVNGILLKLYLKNANWEKTLEFCNPENYWWNNENITGKKILLAMDQAWNGAGDVFQFIRYAQRLHRAGAHVSIKCSPALRPLLSECPYINKIITTENNSIFDKKYNLCIATLMLLMKDEAKSINADVPYLYANKELIQHWKENISQDKNFKIGICWQSSACKSNYTGKLIYGPRSFERKKLAPIAAIEKASLYSLQKESIEQLRKIQPSFALNTFDNLDTKSGAFMDTAALMKNLDLVITVDTSIAHLAGALGVPVWVMLDCNTDYRWFRDRADSPWYPTMRLFRQTKSGDWDSVVQEIVHELKNLLVP